MIRRYRGDGERINTSFLIPDVANGPRSLDRVRESYIELLLLESLILAQDERWRRA